MIVERYPQYPVPSPSTIGDILKRRGLSRRRRKRCRRYPMAVKPFADVVESNATRCVDFKGHFRAHAITSAALAIQEFLTLGRPTKAALLGA